MDAELRRRVLAAAIAARLDKVRRDLVHVTPPAPEPEPAADREGALRILMVRLWPRVETGRESSADLADFFAILASLADAARSEDLRFLDAWNNAYETLASRSPSPIGWSAFLQAYASLLEHHLERLET